MPAVTRAASVSSIMASSSFANTVIKHGSQTFVNPLGSPRGPPSSARRRPARPPARGGVRDRRDRRDARADGPGARRPRGNIGVSRVLAVRQPPGPRARRRRRSLRAVRTAARGRTANPRPGRRPARPRSRVPGERAGRAALLPRHVRRDRRRPAGRHPWPGDRERDVPGPARRGRPGAGRRRPRPGAGPRAVGAGARTRRARAGRLLPGDAELRYLHVLRTAGAGILGG